MVAVNIPVVNSVVTENGFLTKVWYNFFSIIANKLLAGFDVSFGGVLSVDLNTRNNSGSEETELYYYSLPKNLLSLGTEHIEFVFFGTFAANSNTKSLKVKFGETVIFELPPTVINDASFNIEGKIFNSGDNQKIIVSGTDTTVTSIKTVYTEASENLNESIKIALLATGVSNDDITKQGGTLKLFLNR